MFDICVADCPWDYNDKKNNDPKMGGITYNTIKDDELYSLNLLDVTNKDSLLFMWATMPKLKEGIQCLESWGFKYICTPFVWVKLNPNGQLIKENKDITLKGGCYSGLGSYSCGNVEIMLLGKRGKGLKRARKDVKQIQFAPRTRHSQKPEIFQDQIELLYPNVKNLELFARRTREGWTCLGNEVTGNDIRKDLEILRDGIQ